MLVENHSLKPYRQRVLGTYVLLESTIRTLSAEAKSLKAAITADRALRPVAINANWKDKAEPVSWLNFLTIASEEVMSPASGAMVTRFNGKPGPAVKIPVYGSEPGLQLSVAKAYWVSSTKPDVISRLKAHGIAMETLKAAQTVEVDRVRLTGFKTSNASRGAHRRFRPTGVLASDEDQVTFPARFGSRFDRSAAGAHSRPTCWSRNPRTPSSPGASSTEILQRRRIHGTLCDRADGRTHDGLKTIQR